MKQIEKNKEILWEDIEQLCNRPITRANAAELSTYMGALKAMCMICGEEETEEAHAARAREDEKPAHTPERTAPCGTTSICCGRRRTGSRATSG